MLDPKSPILQALYNRRPDEAARLADETATLTIWEAAALGRNTAIGQALAADPASLNSVGSDGHLPLGLAAFFGHASTVRLLLERGADVHAPAQNFMKVQPLHAAVGSRNTDVVRAVLAARPDINARQQVGYTPLMGAAAAGSAELVNLLLEAGADPACVSEDHKTAADVARDHGHLELADRLQHLQSRIRPASAG